MLLQKYRDACASARATLRELDPKRKLDESETRAIVRKVDEILGLPSAPDADSPSAEFRQSPLVDSDPRPPDPLSIKN